jgi:hypothetical protein
MAQRIFLITDYLRDPDQMEANVRAWNLANAQLGGLAEGRLAERFYVADTR